MLVAALVLTGGLGSAVARVSTSFPCRWQWDLHAGLRAGYVTAGSSADCAGRRGSLTLSARLLRWNPQSKTWHADRAQTRTWRDLSGNRYVELTERCTAATFRAVFGWTLRDTGGALVSRHAVRSGVLKVPGPDCRFQIG